MEIYNSSMELVQNPDLTKGRLVVRTKTIVHPAVEAVEEEWHYEVVAEYPNGGKDVQRVVDVQGVEASPEWAEEVEYWLYQEFTPEEQEAVQQPDDVAARIAALEDQLLAAKILLGVD